MSLKNLRFEDGYFDEPVETPEEAARKEFVSGLSSQGFRVNEEELLDLLGALKDKVPSWGVAVERRCLGLFLGCIARSTRSCRIAFVAQEGLKLIGQVLKEAVAHLEANENREEAAKSQTVQDLQYDVLASLLDFPLRNVASRQF